MSHSIVRTKNRWTTAQLELLVEVWEKYYQHLKAGRGNEEIYEMMVDELKAAGCLEATLKQVRGRIHNLSGKYRKEASEVLKTGLPSQWSLYSKISKFFEYSAPVRFKNLGPPVYDMSEYLDMDLVMAGVIDRHTSNRNRAGHYDHPTEFELEENSLDIEDDEIEPDEGSGTADRAIREEYSDLGMYDDENTLDEFPVKDDRRSSQSGQERHNGQEHSEPEEESVLRESERDDSDQEDDSSADDDDITVLEQQIPKSNEVFHIKGAFRQVAIEEFLNQLYSNQLYADVMLITCHDGVTCVMPAHRMVLANFSEFFSSVLGALKPNTNGNPLTLCLQPDISQPVMQLLLQYMYTGKASVTQQLLADFLRCGQILRVRGLWNEEKGKAPEKQTTIKLPLEDRQQRRTDVPSSISDEDEEDEEEEQEERSRSSSSITKAAVLSLKDTSSSTNSSDTEQTTATEQSKKRRKKMTNNAKKMRRLSSEEDEDSVDLEVSSNLGFDLFRSDSESEDKMASKRDKRSSVSNDGLSDGSEDDYDESDENDLDDDDDIVPSTSRTQLGPQTNGKATPPTSNPEQYAKQQEYPQPSTSRSTMLRKVRSVYSCKICGERFKTSEHWVEHVVYEHYERKPISNGESNPEGHITMLQCDLCSKFLGSEYDWVHHVLKKHTERYPHFHEDFSQSDE
uniref:BTB domain-containing protein n=1 Tax=Anopheles maculatus TaxID=74869 RepID=A0A182SQ19_9DIPT